MLYEIIDKMGEASAKAQDLHGPITTGKKLECSNHKLYIMKDAQDKGGYGSVIGILKVGCKKLFVYDESKVQHELEPLCVLDFYVHESRQRMGCGRKLFEFMLQNERIPAHLLAIDRPSPKFLSFLKRHYGLEAVIPQVNNFVIFQGFFNKKPDLGSKSGSQNLISSKPPLGLRNHQKKVNVHQQNIHNLPQSLNRNTSQDPHNNDYSWIVPGISSHSQSHMGAGQEMYSRHGVSSISNINQYRSTPTRGRYTPTRDQSHDTARRQANYSRGSDSGSIGGDLAVGRNNNYPGQGFSKNSLTGQNGKTGDPYSRAGSGDSSSVYQTGNRFMSSMPMVDPRYPRDNLSSHLPPIPSPVLNRPPSGSGRQKNNRANSEPPVLQRNGPPESYQNFLNTHSSTYQGNNKQNLPLQSSALPVAEPVLSAPGYTAHSNNQNTSWTVMGVLRDQRLTSPLASRFNNRLW
ncbi:Alpha-tubulin N-acetyltransferase 1 [Bulinus truncatus]|nr:Alpha-tubulin N-acetyltransferase 1 [Bulinus truncatus]